MLYTVNYSNSIFNKKCICSMKIFIFFKALYDYYQQNSALLVLFSLCRPTKILCLERMVVSLKLCLIWIICAMMRLWWWLCRQNNFFLVIFFILEKNIAVI